MSLLINISLVLGITFFLFSILFALLKDKAALLVSGFNTMPKLQRAQYDQSHLSRDMRNTLFLWAVLNLVSGLIALYWFSYAALIGLIIWIVLFVRDVKWTPEEAFKKYKKEAGVEHADKISGR